MESIREGQFEGRRTFPKKFRDELYRQNGGRCAICNDVFEVRYLQVDHRIPYEIAGEFQGELDRANFMLVCGSCNRAKSWSCEHCVNWQGDKLSDVCVKCYWADPENYVHIALREIRRVDILWNENELGVYEKLKEIAGQNAIPIPDYVKKIIKVHFNFEV